MSAALIPENEAERLNALRRLRLLDSLGETAFDDTVMLASAIFGSPIALISLIDANRQWFKAKVGLNASETHRDHAFCAHAILEPDQVLVVEDAMADDRFSTNPLVTGDPHIRFYAGAPIVTNTGFALGTVCVIDTIPRQVTQTQHAALKALARQAAHLIELRALNELPVGQ